MALNAAGASAAAGGISAMPSMHVLLASLCAVGLLHANRFLGTLAVIYAVLIWFGSVHLGWHYFVDGVVSLVGLAVLWTIFARVFGLYEKP